MEKQSLIEQLKLKNPEIALYTVGDSAFFDYGRVLSFDTVSLEETASKLSTPESGVLYTAIEPTLESCPQMNAIQDKVFGELPIQLGYCRGYNNWLNALEWHTSSEINIAVTPMDRPSRDPLLFRKNKWLLAHVENKALIQEGVQASIYGSNIRVKEV